MLAAQALAPTLLPTLGPSMHSQFLTVAGWVFLVFTFHFHLPTVPKGTSPFRGPLHHLGHPPHTHTHKTVVPAGAATTPCSPPVSQPLPGEHMGLSQGNSPGWAASGPHFSSKAEAECLASWPEPHPHPPASVHLFSPAEGCHKGALPEFFQDPFGGLPQIACLMAQASSVQL